MDVILSLLGLLAGALLSGWLAARALRLRHARLRRISVGLCSGVGVVLVLVAAIATFGVYRLSRPPVASPPDVQAVASPDRLARGEHLANLCTACHSTRDRLPLDGGSQNFLGALATLYAPDLTPAGPLREWSDGEIVRAIRDGVARDGRSLLLMPAANFHSMSDDDVQSLVVYLRSQPPIAHDSPQTQLHLAGAVLSGFGILPIAAQPPTAGPVVAPPQGTTAEYGAYLLTISGCRSCHGSNLTGGTSPVLPHGPSLVAMVPTWSTDQFVSTIRTGRDPYGVQLPPEMMPWPAFAATWTDAELRAIDAYIRGLSG